MKKSDKISTSKIYLAIIILLLLIIVILIGYFTKSYNKINWITKQEIFENDLKCQELLDDYMDELRHNWYTDISVFYSPIENTCLWTFQSYRSYNNDVRYNMYSYTIEKLSDIKKYAYFSVSSYYSWDNLIEIKHISDNFTNNDCTDIDYRNYYNDKEYYDSIKRCKFDNIHEEYEKMLEYLKGN